MSREIKFKAWDAENEYMIAEADLPYLICQNTNTVPEDKIRESYIFLQYTGLKDKNGVEIFESDVLKSPAGENFKVVWNCNGHWGYKRISDNSSISQDWWECEVIGSAYETPKLLEDK